MGTSLHHCLDKRVAGVEMVIPNGEVKRIREVRGGGASGERSLDSLCLLYRSFL